MLARVFAAFGGRRGRVIAACGFSHRSLNLLLKLARLRTNGVELVEDAFQFLRIEIGHAPTMIRAC